MHWQQKAEEADMQGKVLLELYMVRHGESMSNAGTTDDLSEELRNDPPLSEKGVRQAQLLGEYYSDVEFDCILASGLRRASRTAYEVALRQPNGPKAVELHKIFTECGTGEECTGRTIDEIQKEMPYTVCAEGMDAAERIVFHGRHDTDEQLLARGKEAITYLRNRFHNGEKILVAAHAAFNTFMLFAALGLSHEQIFDPSFFNTGITKIVFYEPGTARCGDVHLIYHNAVPHLASETEALSKGQQ